MSSSALFTGKHETEQMSENAIKQQNRLLNMIKKQQGKEVEKKEVSHNEKSARKKQLRNQGEQQKQPQSIFRVLWTTLRQSSPFFWETGGTHETIWFVVRGLQSVKKKRTKDYDTWCSQVVSNPSTNQARRGLTSLIRREVVLSSWYGRNSLFLFLSLSLCVWMIVEKC